MPSIGELYGIGQTQYRRRLEKTGSLRLLLPVVGGGAGGALVGMGHGLTKTPTPERGTAAHVGMGAAGGALTGATLGLGASLGSAAVSKGLRSLADDAVGRVRSVGDEALGKLRAEGDALLSTADQRFRATAADVTSRAAEQLGGAGELAASKVRSAGDDFLRKSRGEFDDALSSITRTVEDQRTKVLDDLTRKGMELADHTKQQATDYGRDVLVPQAVSGAREAAKATAQGAVEGAGEGLLNVLLKDIGGPKLVLTPRTKAAQVHDHDLHDAIRHLPLGDDPRKARAAVEQRFAQQKRPTPVSPGAAAATMGALGGTAGAAVGGVAGRLASRIPGVTGTRGAALGAAAGALYGAGSSFSQKSRANLRQSHRDAMASWNRTRDPQYRAAVARKAVGPDSAYKQASAFHELTAEFEMEKVAAVLAEGEAAAAEILRGL